MESIEQMIKRLCPKGIEYSKLGEVCDIKTGKGITKKDAENSGDFPIISGGITPMGYFHIFNREANVVTVSRVGANAGWVGYMTRKFYLNDKCFSVIPKGTNFNQISPKFLYYYLKQNEQILISLQSEGGVPTINTQKVGSIDLPIPPLEIQNRIVEVLDKMTELEAELEAELEVRKQQYEYYRNKLLTFDENGGGIRLVTWKKMNDVFDMRNGYTPSKAKSDFWEGGTIPWFRMEDIRENGRKLSDSIQHITMKGVKKGILFPANSFILATTATIGEHALITTDSLANQQFTNLSVRKSLYNKLLTDYVFHYMFVIDEWCKNNINVSNFASVDMEKFKNLLFPIPSIEEQARIVSILDRFEALTTDLQSGLPAEIEARRQQYEYYRNKLLTFEQSA